MDMDRSRVIGKILEVFFIVFMPPLAVLHSTKECTNEVLIDAILTLMFWIPGQLYAIWYCFVREYFRKKPEFTQ
ncbi:unnamed protein product [Cylicocyclus nassatus]|uniref:Uncharacterized protein n=1 Tax=Cylicocyclus nassatus TaxID=53992 RepID=A0AA36GML3_CYLNA|nr:unnamed protein product [Cylicocyclus nassatus]